MDPRHLMPDPDAQNADGEVLDAMEVLKTKREMAEMLLPHMKRLQKKQMAIADGEEYQELKKWEEVIKEIAEYFDIDYEAL